MVLSSPRSQRFLVWKRGPAGAAHLTPLQTAGHKMLGPGPSHVSPPPAGACDRAQDATLSTLVVLGAQQPLSEPVVTSENAPCAPRSPWSSALGSRGGKDGPAGQLLASHQESGQCPGAQHSSPPLPQPGSASSLADILHSTVTTPPHSSGWPCGPLPPQGCITKCERRSRLFGGAPRSSPVSA